MLKLHWSFNELEKRVFTWHKPPRGDEDEGEGGGWQEHLGELLGRREILTGGSRYKNHTLNSFKRRESWRSKGLGGAQWDLGVQDQGHSVGADKGEAEACGGQGLSCSVPVQPLLQINIEQALKEC